MTGEEGMKTTGSMEAGDAAAAAVQRTENRVTLEHLNSLVVKEEYTNPMSAPQLTICTLVVENGFCLVGTSAPADEGNFDADLGRQFAREDALKQLWPLEGYLLRQKLHGLRHMVLASVAGSGPNDPAPPSEDEAQVAAAPSPGGLRPLPGSAEVAAAPSPEPATQEAADPSAPQTAATADPPQDIPMPSVGRIVHFASAFRDDMGGMGDWVPAIVTAVHSATCVNLTIFRDGLDPLSKTSVEYGEDQLKSDKPFVWKWPPRV